MWPWMCCHQIRQFHMRLGLEPHLQSMFRLEKISRESHGDCSCTGCLVAQIPPPEEFLEFSTGFCSTNSWWGWSGVCRPVDRSLCNQMVCHLLKCPVNCNKQERVHKGKKTHDSNQSNNKIPTSSCDTWRTNLPKKQAGEPNQISNGK